MSEVGKLYNCTRYRRWSVYGHKDKTMTLNTYFTTIFANTFEESIPSKLDNIFKENDNSMTTSKGMDKMKRYATILP